MKLLLLPSWVSLVRYIEAWQWLWRRRNEVGVIIALWPYLEWALGQGGTCRHTPSLFQLKTQDWSLAGCTVSTKNIFTVSTKYWLDPFLFPALVIKKTMVILNEKNKLLLWFLLLLLVAYFIVLYIEESKNIQSELQRKWQMSLYVTIKTLIAIKRK